MPEIVNEIEQDLVNAYKKISGEFCAHAVFAELYFKVFFSAEPIGINELAEDTGYSISTVSNTMKALEKLMDVERFKKPGSKKIYFRCKHDLMEISERIISMRCGFIAIAIKTMQDAEEKLNKSVDPGAKETLEKVKNMRVDCEKIETMLKDLLLMHKDAYKDKSR